MFKHALHSRPVIINDYIFYGRSDTMFDANPFHLFGLGFSNAKALEKLEQIDVKVEQKN